MPVLNGERRRKAADVTAVLATRATGGVYRSYARGAAVAFSLVVSYTVLKKVPSGELARDWTHTALHVVTTSVAVYAGWISGVGRRPRHSRPASRSSTARSAYSVGSRTAC